MRLRGGTHLTVESLVLGGREVLVGPGALPAPYRVHGERAGITLLHPWANRLRDGAPPDAPTDPAGVPIHGLPGAWEVRGEAAVGRYGWPVEHEVRVAFEREDDLLRVVTELDAPEPVPVAFGWHPYLRPAGPRDGWELRLPERVELGLDDQGLPTGERVARAAEAAPLGGRAFDHAYAGGGTWGCGDLEVVLEEGLGAAQVFAPLDAEVVSLEPMAAPVDGWHEAPRATRARAVWSLRRA